MSAIASALAAVRRSDPTPDLPADKRWIAARDHESALLTLATARTEAGAGTYSDQRTLAAKAYDDAEDFACEAYGTRVLPIQRGRR